MSTIRIYSKRKLLEVTEEEPYSYQFPASVEAYKRQAIVHQRIHTAGILAARQKKLKKENPR